MDPKTQTELEAAAFRQLLAHLESRKDLQNVDLMSLAKWYRAAAEDHGIALSDEAARERIYGMPYAEWKTKYQK